MFVHVWLPGEHARSTTRLFSFPDEEPFTLLMYTLLMGTLLGYASQSAVVVLREGGGAMSSASAREMRTARAVDELVCRGFKLSQTLEMFLKRGYGSRLQHESMI